MKVEGHWWCPTEGCRRRQLAHGISVQEGMRWRRVWVPLPKQVEFLAARGKRKLFGGAAGGSKSNVARFGAYRLCMMLAGLSVLLLRRTHPELERTHIRAMRREQTDLGFDFREATKEARFPNGSVIECGHMDDSAAVQKYLSSEYDLIILEEAVQYGPDDLLEVMSRARTSNEAVKAAGGPWVWLPTNPGGPSHHVLKELFRDHTPDVERYPAFALHYDPADWVYTHATLDDNPYIDDDYETVALAGLRKARYAQLRHGDWDAAEGTFFEHFSARTHAIVRPLPVRGQWIEAMDWGYRSPGCLGFFARVGDSQHWHCYKAVKFQGMEPEAVAELVHEARRALGYVKPQYGIADPSIDMETRGESIAATFRRHGVFWQLATNKRFGTDTQTGREMGWPRLGAWFRIDPQHGEPWLTFDPHEASYLVRTLPALLADAHNPEDIDTDLDDHGADMCRYFVMSRPPLRTTPTASSEPPPLLSPAWFRARVAVREDRGARL